MSFVGFLESPGSPISSSTLHTLPYFCAEPTSSLYFSVNTTPKSEFEACEDPTPLSPRTLWDFGFPVNFRSRRHPPLHDKFLVKSLCIVLCLTILPRRI